MKALLDAHAILWVLFQPHLLPARVRLLLEDKGNELLHSHASLWELLAKIEREELLVDGDPFDRMQTAQALTTGVPIITADPMINRYGVDVIWS